MKHNDDEDSVHCASSTERVDEIDPVAESDEESSVDRICEDEAHQPRTWLDRLAIFGDSESSLMISFLILVVSCFLALSEDPMGPCLQSWAALRAAVNERYAKPMTPKKAPPVIYEIDLDASDTPGSFLSRNILQAYERDGVIAVRGLLPDLDKIDDASQALVQQNYEKKRRKRGGSQFHTVMTGPALYLDSDNAGEITHAFRQVALESALPRIAAELMSFDDTDSNTKVRMLRDIFLAKDDGQYICGWHVDDTGFWPATADSPGVNAWIALDDMPLDGGGGFALAVGSHAADYREEAHLAIGATTTMPPQGYANVSDMFDQRRGYGTCNLETTAPAIHESMTQSERVYDLRKGDVIFADRWLFHRTVPLNRAYWKEKANDLVYRRYSVRYAPGSAVIPPGYGVELSVLSDPDNAGKTADDIDGPWYPRCWPGTDPKEQDMLDDFMSEKVPPAQAIRKQRQQEMQPYLQENGKRKKKMY